MSALFHPYLCGRIAAEWLIYMEDLVLLVLGILLVIIGIVNMTGNVSTVHSYNRRKVKEEDIPKYGKAVGAGTVLMGAAIAVSYFLNKAGFSQIGAWIAAGAIAAGLGFILYGQFKYNKGLF